MRRGNNKIYMVLTAVIGLLVFFHYINFLNPVENIIINISKPLLIKFYSGSSYIRRVFSAQAEKRDLSKLLKDKEDEVNRLIAENAELKYIEEENEILRQYLKFSKEQNKILIIGNILSRGGLISDTNEKNIIVDKGKVSGVNIGFPALNSQGLIIGKVIDVKDNSAEICLIINSDCKIAAAIENNEKTIGIASGQHGLTIKMEFIPQTVIMKEGDVVITSGLEPNIPRGLVIGKVSKIDKESNELWQNATIEPLLNFDNLVVVSILTK